MRLLLLLSLVALHGCATLSAPPPLTREEVIAMAKAGEAPPAIVARLRETGTVIPLSASDIVNLHQAGVPAEVLDHLQVAQIVEARRREALFSGMHNCPWSARLHSRAHPRFPAYAPGVWGPWGPC
jgi:hypothetical protein